MRDEDTVYHDLLGHVMHLLEHKLPPTMIAAALMAIAQRLYKTQLNDREYREMMEVIKDAPVKPYEKTKVRIH